jgi:hypothetical protein
MPEFFLDRYRDPVVLDAHEQLAAFYFFDLRNLSAADRTYGRSQGAGRPTPPLGARKIRPTQPATESLKRECLSTWMNTMRRIAQPTGLESLHGRALHSALAGLEVIETIAGSDATSQILFLFGDSE